MDIKIFIVFCSPSGSTKYVAKIIKKAFRQRDAEVVMLDLGSTQDRPEVLDAINEAGKHACLFIGSPVYRNVAIPPVMRFIEVLPKMVDAFAVPYVTWGKACSGVALWQMSEALMKKGYRIVGAAKVLAEHSMMWRVENPPGKGHPDDTDIRKINKLVGTLYTRFNSDKTPVLSLDTLDYQPHERAAEMKENINALWKIASKHVNTETCTQCGVCEEECPVAAISLNPYPEFALNCFDCFNCIRLCPENAIEPASSMNQIEDRIRRRVRTINEQPVTQIFL
jgi:ferredoxin/flavodoxin